MDWTSKVRYRSGSGTCCPRQPAGYTPQSMQNDSVGGLWILNPARCTTLTRSASTGRTRPAGGRPAEIDTRRRETRCSILPLPLGSFGSCPTQVMLVSTGSKAPGTPLIHTTYSLAKDVTILLLTRRLGTGRKITATWIGWDVDVSPVRLRELFFLSTRPSCGTVFCPGIVRLATANSSPVPVAVCRFRCKFGTNDRGLALGCKGSLVVDIAICQA